MRMNHGVETPWFGDNIMLMMVSGVVVLMMVGGVGWGGGVDDSLGPS